MFPSFFSLSADNTGRESISGNADAWSALRRHGRPTSLVDSAACASDEYPTPRLFSLAPERSAEATILQAAWHSDEPQPSAGGICPDRPPPLPGTVPAPGQ